MMGSVMLGSANRLHAPPYFAGITSKQVTRRRLVASEPVPSAVPVVGALSHYPSFSFDVLRFAPNPQTDQGLTESRRNNRVARRRGSRAAYFGTWGWCRNQ